MEVVSRWSSLIGCKGTVTQSDPLRVKLDDHAGHLAFEPEAVVVLESRS